jgi:hypothetical protein
MNLTRTGGSALALLAICLGLSACWPDAPATPPAPPSGPQVGRFVIVHSSQVERDTILLDTATGKTWSRVEISDLRDDPVAWEPMPQLNSPKDYAAMVAGHPSKTDVSDPTGGFTPVVKATKIKTNQRRH